MRDHMPPGNENRVRHARMVLDQSVLMAGDAMTGCEPSYQGMNGFSLTLSYVNAAEAKPVFDALSEGGIVTMPLQKPSGPNPSACSLTVSARRGSLTAA